MVSLFNAGQKPVCSFQSTEEKNSGVYKGSRVNSMPEMINASRVNILVFQRQMHFFISWLSPWNCIIAVIKAQWLP